MLFHSYEFIFAFLPLVLAGYGICRRIAGKRAGNQMKNLPLLFLLAASFVFYGLGGLPDLLLLLAGMAVNYGLCRWMEQSGQAKKALFLGILFHVGALCFFKYAAGGRLLPLAVSFYTFTQIAFLVECYRGNLSLRELEGTEDGQGSLPKSRFRAPLLYGLYVTYFPKMIQGPIVLPGEFFPKLLGGSQEKGGSEGCPPADWERIFRSLYLFLLGLFKKVLIADTFGGAVDLGYAALPGLNSVDAVIVMLSYTLQLYFDFSGYCDMAMGVSGLLGIELPLNFHSPYKAANILEFWKGWHITLTGFFTRYVYIPLGGNRKGRARSYVNVLIVFALSGIWHGTGVQFLIWGMMHGILYVATRAVMAGSLYRRFADRYGSMQSWAKKVFRGIAVFLTFLYVNAAWVFFRAPSVQDAVSLLSTIIRAEAGRVNWELAGCFNLDEFWYVIKVLHIDRWQYAHYICMALILAAVLLLVFFGRTSVDYVKRTKPKWIHSLIMTGLFLWSILSLTGVSSFLYVNF